MLDRAARSTVRNFSTLFLICLVLLLPLEIAYGFLHKGAIANHEIRPFIVDLGEGTKIQGVGSPEFESAERNRVILTVIEVALLPLFIAAARRAIERDRLGELPSATDAYVHGLAPPRIGPAPPARAVGAVGLAALFAFVLAFAALRGGGLLVDLFPDRFRFVMLGLVEASARSLALPWFLGAWIVGGEVPGRGRRGPGPARDPFNRPPQGKHRVRPRS
jgi:hypothetical protein